MKRKLMAIFAVMIMLGSVVTALELTATAQAPTVSATSQPNIVGKWQRTDSGSTGDVWTVYADRTLNVVQGGGAVGHATWVQKSTYYYEFHWVGSWGGLVDYITVAADGNSFSGHNSAGFALNAVRIRSATSLTIATSTAAPTTNVPFTLSGTLKSGTATLANQPVHLERRTGTTGTWANVAGTFKYTNAYGKVTVSQKISTAGTYQYRWHYYGTATYKQAYSAVVTETVKKPTSMAISTTPTTPKFNQLFTVWGVLKSGTTPLAGYYVHLERKIGSGSWVTVAGTTKKTGTGGLVFMKQTMTSHHTYYYRWHFMGTATYKPSYSPVKTFTV